VPSPHEDCFALAGHDADSCAATNKQIECIRPNSPFVPMLDSQSATHAMVQPKRP
jgi:hypothetical protein